MKSSLRFLTGPGKLLDEAPEDIVLTQAKGLIGNRYATPCCTTAEFLTRTTADGQDGADRPLADQ